MWNQAYASVDQPVEDLDRSGQRLDAAVLQRRHLLLEQRPVFAPQALMDLAALRGEPDQHHPRIARVAVTLNPAAMLEPVDEHVIAGWVTPSRAASSGDPPWPLRQRSEALATMLLNSADRIRRRRGFSTLAGTLGEVAEWLKALAC